MIPRKHQAHAIAEVPRLIGEGQRKICVTSPTGGGKTLIICHNIEWAIEQRWGAVLYTNRKLLIDQLRSVLHKHGISFGVRASGHEDNRHMDVQISSLPTEGQRVLKTQKWDIHGGDRRILAIVDEAHLNKAETAQTILGMHHERGDAYVGFTATPIDLAHLYESLIVAGTNSELRDMGVLVNAVHYGPDEPDMRGFKQNVKTGEYTEGDIKKAIMNKAILGRVLNYYKALNPDRIPTLLFAPGVPESVWFAEQLNKAGVRACHIDGEGYWLDGEYVKTNDPDDRAMLLKQIRNGTIEVTCNRFVMREGIDIPEIGHIILATVMGSLQTYLQSLGRGLRACPGKNRLTIQDHGGHWWRHGSVNVDRNWSLGCTEATLADDRKREILNSPAREPICCPQCQAIRASGPKCLVCGHEYKKRTRMVLQQNGELIEHEGPAFRPKFVDDRPDTEKLWEQCYWRMKKSKRPMTFRQAMGLFAQENHYWPPEGLPLMPTNPADWFLAVKDVPMERLVPKEKR